MSVVLAFDHSTGPVSRRGERRTVGHASPPA
jgi:hypothetical protein